MSVERLQKYLARCGVASRRACEELIKDGKVYVNGKKVVKMGFIVDAEKDKVSIDGARITPKAKNTYILLNKPAGVVSTCDDPQKRRTVMDLIPYKQRLYPVGRLDYETEGLLLLTDDGALANALTHPKYEIPKTYQARVSGLLTREKRESLERGLLLEDGATRPAKVKVEYYSKEESGFFLTITEGRNRQVRRMCEALGLPVIGLRRTKMGFLDLSGLDPGKHRHLKTWEVERLFEYIREDGKPIIKKSLRQREESTSRSALTGPRAPVRARLPRR